MLSCSEAVVFSLYIPLPLFFLPFLPYILDLFINSLVDCSHFSQLKQCRFSHLSFSARETKRGKGTVSLHHIAHPLQHSYRAVSLATPPSSFPPPS